MDNRLSTGSSSELSLITSEQRQKLDVLSVQMQNAIRNQAYSMYELGRVLTEAKQTLDKKDRAWTEWVQSFGLGIRWAQVNMQAYRRINEQPALAELPKGVLVDILSLSNEMAEKLIAENDLASMTHKQRIEVVKAAKGTTSNESSTDPVLEDDDRYSAHMRKQDADVEQMRSQYKGLFDEYTALKVERDNLKKQVDDQEASISILQAMTNKESEDAIGGLSREIHAGSETTDPNKVDPDAFSRSVAMFISTNSTLPFQQVTFSTMDHASKQVFRTEVKRLTEWLNMVNDAINCEQEVITYE